MNVEVLFFASLKEELGVASLGLNLPRANSRAALLESLRSELGSERSAPLFQENIAIAINQTIERGDFTLNEGDEIAFLPPITGG